MKFALPEAIKHDIEGIEFLVSFYQQAKDLFFDEIKVDLQKTYWFDADMCGPFGAILHRLSSEPNTVHLVNIQPGIKKIFSKNGFLKHYGGEELIDDAWNTTISYRKFDVSDERYFANYISNELMRRVEIPAMSSQLRKEFDKSIFEIFQNAVMHSKTKLGIFSCGQFFPKKKILNFSITDLGIGFQKNIKESTGLNFTPEEAIKWATDERNTSKRDKIPGGLGLKLLREFVDLNKGRIQIISDKGYWERKGKNTVTKTLNFPFPGTIVSIEINTADSHSYSLASQTSVTNNVF